MDWLNSIFAITNVIFAFFLLRETIKLREVETEPEISIFLEQNIIMGVYDIVVKNIGKGSAYNIHFYFDKNADIFSRISFRPIFELGFFEGVKYMAPNQEYRTMFGGHELFAKPLPTPLEIKVEYSNKNLKKKKNYEEMFEINPGNYWGTSYIDKKNLNDINDQLVKISNNIKDLKKIK